MESEQSNTYDFLIIGAGGTGLAAGMYAGRLGMKTLILGATHGSELPIGGTITTTDVVENYPGFSKITGFELAKNLEKHARDYSDLVSIKNEKAIEVAKSGKWFNVKTEKSEYKALTLLFATGTKWRKLTVPGAKEFETKGVYYCALCDGPLFKNKEVAVVGGGNSAAKDALILARHAKKVYLIARRENLTAEPANIEKINQSENIELITERNIEEVKGNKFVESIVLDKPHKGKKELNVEGVFVAIGHVALSELAESLGVELARDKEIPVNPETKQTNIPGVYAAGDVVESKFKQLITGVAEGCIAAYSAYEHITKNKFVR